MIQVCDIFRTRVAQFVHTCVNGDVPCAFENYYSAINEMHSYKTRHSNKLHVLKTRTRMGEESIKVIGAKMYNNLPQSIVECKTKQSFRHKMKLHILKGYE